MELLASRSGAFAGPRGRADVRGASRGCPDLEDDHSAKKSAPAKQKSRRTKVAAKHQAIRKKAKHTAGSAKRITTSQPTTTTASDDVTDPNNPPTWLHPTD